MTQLSHKLQEKKARPARSRLSKRASKGKNDEPTSSTATPGPPTGAVRPQSTTNQPAVPPTFPPYNHIPGDYRSPIRAQTARHERGFVVEQPPQEVLCTPERGHLTKRSPREPTGSPIPQHVSPTKPFLREPNDNLIQQGGFTVRLPQYLLRNPVPQSGSKVEPLSHASTGTPRQELSKILATSLKPILSYIAEVLFTVLRLMKYPIAMTLALMTCAYAVAIMSDAVTSALAPMCSFPVISRLCPAGAPVRPSHPPNPKHTPLWADFPKLVKVEDKAFESLIDETLEGAGLALEIKKAELATSDLVTLVRVSDMDSSKILTDALSGFEKDARKASRRLTRFGSKVGGAVDKYVHLLPASP